MPHRPEIFISATTKDLKTCRQLVRDALLTLGCVPVVQDHFAPDARTVREMLREKIAGCDAVVHLAGECYGFEPQERADGEARRSYTQMEYDAARALHKPVYTFLCADGFPYDAHPPESDELRVLQQEHRAVLAAGEHVFVPVKDTPELEKSVRELQTRLEHVARDLRRTRSWLGQGLAAMVVVLALVGGGLLLVHRRAADIQEQNTVLQQQTRDQAQQIAAMQVQLQQQTRTTEQVLAAIQRFGFPLEGKTDPVADAQAQVAKERGVSVEELRKQLADEQTDLRALLARIDAQGAGTPSEMAPWRRLKREVLTQLGNSENAAGRHPAAIEFYRQALALTDKEKEPLAWCEVTALLGGVLAREGLYSEAEPLAREVVAQRTAKQGAEHPDTLSSVEALVILLYNKGAYSEGQLEEPAALYRRLLEARERLLGKEHQDSLRTASGLALVLTVAHHYPEAITLYERLLASRENRLGKNHPEVLKTIYDLASLCYNAGNLTKAEALYRRALSGQRDVCGSTHPDTLQTANDFAVLLVAEGNNAEAEQQFRQVLDDRRRVLGDKSYGVAITAFNYADLLSRQNRPRLKEALVLADLAASAARASMAPNYPPRQWCEDLLKRVQAEAAKDNL